MRLMSPLSFVGVTNLALYLNLVPMEAAMNKLKALCIAFILVLTPLARVVNAQTHSV